MHADASKIFVSADHNSRTTGPTEYRQRIRRTAQAIETVPPDGHLGRGLFDFRAPSYRATGRVSSDRSIHAYFQ